MKTIGLIGGTTWHSTIDYYKLINEEVNRRLGGHTTARIIINSVNFKILVDFNEANDWVGVEKYIGGLANDLENAGAECLLLGANTLHKIADNISKRINIPIIHVAKETAKVIQAKGLKKVALLGTKVTMTSDFYKDILSDNGIKMIIPDEKDMELIHYSIYEEFSKGIFSDEMKSNYLRIIETLKKQNVEGIILGCTEIPILIKPEDSNLPLFNTTEIHVNAAVNFSLKD